VTMNQNGSVTCDRDGWDVGNGSVTNALVVSDLDPDRPGHVRTLHFCRDVRDEDGNVTHPGCDKKVLSARNMAHFKETHDAT
jgi:hypothetical protein